MQSIRSFFIAISAICIFALTTLLTMSVAVVLIAMVAAASIMKMISNQMRPVPTPVYGKAKSEPRIWNDGKGTIIDL